MHPDDDQQLNDSAWIPKYHVYAVACLVLVGFKVVVLSYIGRYSKALRRQAQETVDELNKELRDLNVPAVSRQLPIQLAICDQRRGRYGKSGWHSWLASDLGVSRGLHIDDARDICGDFSKVHGEPHTFRIAGSTDYPHPRGTRQYNSLLEAALDILNRVKKD